MKKMQHFFLLSFSIVALAATQGFAQSGQNVFYQGSYDEFLRAAKKQNKKALLLFRSDECGSCQKLEKETFSDPDLVSYLNEGFLVSKIDMNTNDGKLLMNKYRVKDYPVLVVVDSDLRSAGSLTGVYPSEEIRKELEKIRGKIMVTASW